MHLKLLKCSFDINVGFLEMRSCYDQMSSHNFAMSRTPPPSQSLSHGYGSKQRRECRTADTLSTELSQHNIYSFFSGLSNSKVVGLLVKLKPE